MTLIKITNRGDGHGALSIHRNNPIPTYGETITVDETDYLVEDVERICARCRADVVIVDVTPTVDKPPIA